MWHSDRLASQTTGLHSFTKRCMIIASSNGPTDLRVEARRIPDEEMRNIHGVGVPSLDGFGRRERRLAYSGRSMVGNTRIMGYTVYVF